MAKKIEVTLGIPLNIQLEKDQYNTVGRVLAEQILKSIRNPQRLHPTEVIPKIELRISPKKSWLIKGEIAGEQVTLILPILEEFNISDVAVNLIQSSAHTFLRELASQQPNPFREVSVLNLTYSNT